MPQNDLPTGFNAIQLVELFDLIEPFMEYSRADTRDEDDGEDELLTRARRLMTRYTAAT